MSSYQSNFAFTSLKVVSLEMAVVTDIEMNFWDEYMLQSTVEHKRIIQTLLLGEAGVPFFHQSGSEFDEIFVGTGAKKVRTLFSKNTLLFSNIALKHMAYNNTLQRVF